MLMPYWEKTVNICFRVNFIVESALLQNYVYQFVYYVTLKTHQPYQIRRSLSLYSLDLIFPTLFNEMDYKSDLCCDHTTILSTLIISHAVVIFNMV